MRIYKESPSFVMNLLLVVPSFLSSVCSDIWPTTHCVFLCKKILLQFSILPKVQKFGKTSPFCQRCIIAELCKIGLNTTTTFGYHLSTNKDFLGIPQDQNCNVRIIYVHISSSNSLFRWPKITSTTSDCK